MIQFIVILLGVFGGFIVGREYERLLLVDRLIDLAHEHRRQMEELK
jgi:hypothetical protein